jgi:hypothetical protein
MGRMKMNGSILGMIRSEQRAIVTLVALMFGPLFMAGPAVLGIGYAISAGFSPRSLAALPVALAVSTFFAYHMLQNYHWVELDGETIRGRRFWTRRYVERRVGEIREVVPLVNPVKTAPVLAMDRMLGPNRGYEIRFEEGAPRITLVRGDMTNVQQLAEAVLARLPGAAIRPSRNSASGDL